MVEHDRLFKELLTQFIHEFIELFLPDVKNVLEPNTLHFVDKEMHSELGLGNKRTAGLLAKARIRGKDAFFLLHVEHEAHPRTDLPRRMFRYFSILYERHGDLPIYPVALLSYQKPRKAAASTYEVSCMDRKIVTYRFRVIQLNRMDWRGFLKHPNPVVAALMSRMKISPRERVKVKIASLRMLANLKLNLEKKRFVSAFVDQYLSLSEGESIEFSQEIDKIGTKERQALIELTTSWKEEGRAEGLAEGRRAGIIDSLEVRFGSIPDTLRSRLSEVSDLSRLRELARLAVSVGSLVEFSQSLAI